MSVIKDIVLWKYERASWQWDVLCLLIIAFIFGTPKSWFDERDVKPRPVVNAAPSMNPAPDKPVADKPVSTENKRP